MRFTKRIPAIFLVVVLLFTTVFTINVIAASNSYSPRLTAPSYDNSYYYSDKNLYYRYGYGMPNCTAYAYGRAYEILGKEPNLCPYSAEEWYGYNKRNGYYSYGSTPKIGSIACWSYNGGGGHVAVVEKIENGTITMSNSAWSGINFYISTASVNDPLVGGNSWWNFQGYIYLGDFGGSVTPEPTKPVTYTKGVYKVDDSDGVNMRSGAGTSYSKVTYLSCGTSVQVTEVNKAEGYTWGKCTSNGKTGWIALDFCKYISELPAPEPTTAAPTTVAPTTAQPTTAAPTTVAPTTVAPTTAQPTTVAPTTKKPIFSPLGSELQYGDVNLDGKVDINDATIIARFCSDLAKFNMDQRQLADVNGDGKIDVLDVSIIQRNLVG